MTPVNVLKVKRVREDAAEDISIVWTAKKVAKIMVGPYCGASELYNTFGKEEVDERVQELDQGRKALKEHRLDGDRVLMVTQLVPMKFRIAGVMTHAVTFFYHQLWRAQEGVQPAGPGSVDEPGHQALQHPCLEHSASRWLSDHE